MKTLLYYLIALIYQLFEDKEYRTKSFSLNLVRVRELEQKYRTRLLKAGILESKDRRAMFWAQLAHESGLKPISENMNYSASGLLKIFPKYFNPQTALWFQRRPESIANIVYANRMGNGPSISGDGWKYRGRGFIQNTGKNQYRQLSFVLKLKLIDNPDLLIDEPNAMVAAIHYWTQNNLNNFADKKDVRGATRRINGGLNGLNDRIDKYNTLIRLL